MTEAALLLTGTDSKAGGPDYLLQFMQAKSIGEKVLQTSCLIRGAGSR